MELHGELAVLLEYHTLFIRSPRYVLDFEDLVEVRRLQDTPNRIRHVTGSRLVGEEGGILTVTVATVL